MIFDRLMLSVPEGEWDIDSIKDFQFDAEVWIASFVDELKQEHKHAQTLYVYATYVRLNKATIEYLRFYSV